MTASQPGVAPAAQNRLKNATSPYLLQHAHNPVDWYEWGPEALDKARRENKPIFLSIGYSACHWCHVMAHESFESPEIAAVLNRLFVNIKVDREERPDIDEIYMQATLIMNQGQGGWPMSVWLTPEQQPFFAGTYFPPASRWGRPGFRELCERIGELWQSDRDKLAADAGRLSAYVAQSLATARGAEDAPLSLAHVDQTVDLLHQAFDAQRGGLTSGGSNKFPPSMAMDLLLRAARRSADAARATRLREAVSLTLDRMARGGIYDQLAGGIARYSTDVEWLVPHFEKMLYDQALVADIYLDAYQVTGNPQFARIAGEILEYVLDDMQAPEGGFYSARDADSEGVEGKYYVWTRQQVMDVLGPDDGSLACTWYDVSESGNWQDPHEPGTPKNVLHTPKPLDVVARMHHLTPEVAAQRLAAARQKLLQARAQRTAPGRDEKVLCEWNGLMISAMARGGCVLNQPRYVLAAKRAAEFILTRQLREGRLLRASRAGQTLETAFLTDYAAMIEAALDLYEATFERRWLDHAVALNDAAIRLFADRAQGGFFFTPSDHETLIARSKDVRDNATPSGNSVQLMNLLRLAAIRDDAELRRVAQQTMTLFAGDLLRQPGAGERFLQAVEFAIVGPVEIAIVGSPTDARTQALLRVVHETYLPNRVLMLLDPERPDAAPVSPLLRGRTLVDGAPAAYVCRNYACERPVTSAAALRALLDSGPR